MRSRYIQNRILYYLSDGKRHTISEIAQTLEISYKTVQRHITDLSIDYTTTTTVGKTTLNQYMAPDDWDWEN